MRTSLIARHCREEATVCFETAWRISVVDHAEVARVRIMNGHPPRCTRWGGDRLLEMRCILERSPYLVPDNQRPPPSPAVFPVGHADGRGSRLRRYYPRMPWKTQRSRACINRTVRGDTVMLASALLSCMLANVFAF